MKINRAWSVFEWSGVTLMPDPVKLPIKCVWRTQRRNENYIEKGNTYNKLQARGNASDLVSDVAAISSLQLRRCRKCFFFCSFCFITLRT